MLTLKQQAALHVAKVILTCVGGVSLALTSIAYLGGPETFCVLMLVLLAFITRDIYLSRLETLERLEELNKKMAK